MEHEFEDLMCFVASSMSTNSLLEARMGVSVPFSQYKEDCQPP
jgi:hypothetical protein